MSGVLDAAKLAGLLADDDRRKVFAALVLGAVSLDDVLELSGLGARAAIHALARLQASGLVIGSEHGALVLLNAVFGEAARTAAPSDTAPVNERERVLRTFVRDGRLTSFPTQRSKRLIVLDLIAQDFEPGLRYSELEVNAIVGRWHDDYAAIRRWLVDELFMDREAGFYWRSGGSAES
jgi:hypothetical protein